MHVIADFLKMIIRLAQAVSKTRAQDASRSDRIPSGAEAQPVSVAVAARVVWVETQTYQSCPFTKPRHFVAFCNLPEQTP